MPSYIGIIPARYGSSRFPGKPLALLGDMTMIERVYRRASKVLPEVVVATDDKRIMSVVESFGGKAVMTSATHRSGTDRCREAYHIVGSKADVVINIQGDEPFISLNQINSVMKCFGDETVKIASLARIFDPQRGYDDLADPNLVKVVMSDNLNALYFSRAVIPYFRGASPQEALMKNTYYSHVGLYAYRASTLDQLGVLPQSPLELAESLEQLRWLQAGYQIRMAVTTEDNIGIDTPADLEAALDYLSKHHLD